MAPILHCVRHAQGWHNLSEENMTKIHDPSLTSLGREQAIHLSKIFPNVDSIERVVASPLRRTIQTAFLAFDPVMERKGLKLLLLPEAQETTSRKADTGSYIWKLQREFGSNRLDTALLPKKWNQIELSMDESSQATKEKARQTREWIRDQDVQHLLLVTHGGFLHYLTETLDEAPDGEGSTDWVNTEYRSFAFTSDDEAHLIETEESRNRRKERPLSGAEVEEPQWLDKHCRNA